MALNQVGLERLNTATTKKIGTNKNLIINGAFTVQQRMTSATTGGQNLTGIKTVDRFSLDFSGTDNSPTQIPVDVAAGTTPYTSGFRRCFKIINGNQTSGAGAGDFVTITYKTEAQDLANSGWNYLSSSSYITLSFWVKASVAQNYYFRFQTKDGSSYNYPMETGSLSADTWTKITKTIPGNSNLQIDNDNGEGPKIEWSMFKGTDHTASGVTLNQWAAYADGTHTPDQTSTWYTTNDATFELTGVQLEVGSVATDFEHTAYADELLRCQRYFWQSNGQLAGTQPADMIHGDFINKSTTVADCSYRYAVRMRAAPTVATSGQFKFDSQATVNLTSLVAINNTEVCSQLRGGTDGSLNASAGIGYSLLTSSNTAFLSFSAEL